MEDVIEYLAEQNEDAVLLDGLDDSIIGTYESAYGTVAVYSEDKIVENFIRNGMTREEALEYFSFNTERSLPYLGNYAPIIIKLYN